MYGKPITDTNVTIHAAWRNSLLLCCVLHAFVSCSWDRMYGKPITDGQDRNATAREREVGAAIGALSH